jgi:hypothetical protein
MTTSGLGARTKGNVGAERAHLLAGAMTLALLLPLAAAGPAHAGCGCDKPPPPLAAVRPAFAAPGDVVTLFAPGLEAGVSYEVVFAGAPAPVTVTAIRRRDFADGVEKPQLVVATPALPPGPTRIEIEGILRVDATEFTVLQRPLALSQSTGVTVAECYRAAVGSDGTVYLRLDISAIAARMAFSGIGRAFPLLFEARDVLIYNTQGVLMQLLGPAQAGIFAIDDPGAPDSFELIYDRHEFLTYRSEHLHEGGRGLDPADPAWHVDGTRHIDHDQLVLALRGVVEGEGLPAPGVTPAFDLDIATALLDEPSGSPVTTRLTWSAECEDD